LQKKLKILKELKTLLVENFGGNIKDVILFGSRAGKASSKNSDFDILVILNNDYDWKYKKRIIEVSFEIDLKYEILTDIKIISAAELGNSVKGLHPLYEEAINQGIYA